MAEPSAEGRDGDTFELVTGVSGVPTWPTVEGWFGLGEPDDGHDPGYDMRSCVGEWRQDWPRDPGQIWRPVAR